MQALLHPRIHLSKLAIDAQIMVLIALPRLRILGLHLGGIQPPMGQDRAQQMLGALAHQVLNHFGGYRGQLQIGQHAVERR